MWKVETVSPTVHRIRIPYQNNTAWEQKILVTADRHIDNKYSDLKKQRNHLNQAKQIHAPVLDFGDFFDVMQAKKDPRACRSALLAYLHNKEDYFDAVVDFGYTFIKPYSDIIAFLGKGNHETSVLNHNETNLINRLVRRLRDTESPVVPGAYSGWIKLMFSRENNNGGRQCINIRYTHGGGGTAPVTKGVIKTNRRAVDFPDAHIVLSGHSHEEYRVPIARERISDLGKVYSDEQLHVQIPSYKNATTGVSEGWEVEKEMMTKPTGAFWLVFKYNRSMDKIIYDAHKVM